MENHYNRPCRDYRNHRIDNDGRLRFVRIQTALIATPPLTGGIVAAIVMSEAASKLGFESLAVLAIITYVMQGFVGYPLTAMMLKKEGNRLLAGFRSGEIKHVKTEKPVDAPVKKKLFPATPENIKQPMLF